MVTLHSEETAAEPQPGRETAEYGGLAARSPAD